MFNNLKSDVIANSGEDKMFNNLKSDVIVIQEKKCVQ